EKILREREVYDAIDDHWVEYMRICLDHPGLDVFDVPIEKPRKLQPNEERQELIILTMLFDLFERTYLFYRDVSKDLEINQWAAWEKYITSYIERPNVRAAWEKSGDSFDARFKAYLDKVVRDSAAPQKLRL